MPTRRGCARAAGGRPGPRRRLHGRRRRGDRAPRPGAASRAAPAPRPRPAPPRALRRRRLPRRDAPALPVLRRSDPRSPISNPRSPIPPSTSSTPSASSRRSTARRRSPSSAEASCRSGATTRSRRGRPACRRSSGRTRRTSARSSRTARRAGFVAARRGRGGARARARAGALAAPAGDPRSGRARAPLRGGEPRRRRPHGRAAPAAARAAGAPQGGSMILEPFARLYGSLLEARAHLYATGRLPSRRLPHPTISVGNITFGGTGKTPFVEWLARRLRFEGRHPAILSRGYGRRSRGVVVVSEGDGPLVDADRGGDEPVELARRLPGVVDRRRASGAPRPPAAAGAARRRPLPPRRRLPAPRRSPRRRTCSCSTRATRSAAASFPPRGRLREPLSALARADAFVFTRIDRAEPPAAVRRALAAARPEAPGLHRAHPGRGRARRERLAGRPAALGCAARCSASAGSRARPASRRASRSSTSCPRRRSSFATTSATATARARADPARRGVERQLLGRDDGEGRGQALGTAADSGRRRAARRSRSSRRASSPSSPRASLPRDAGREAG